MFAYKHSVVTSAGQHGRIFRARNARLGHAHHSSRHLWSHPRCSVGIDSESHKVSLVHTDQIGASGNSTIEFGFVMNFDQRVEPNGTGQLQK
jgi:hypothetical protein